MSQSIQKKEIRLFGPQRAWPHPSAHILTRMDNEVEKRAIGSRIRAERARCGISQRKLALMTGTSRSSLRNIETGAADVGIDVLIRIARALDVHVRDLIEF